MTKPPPLNPSKLGEQTYWNTLYTTELTNHAADPSDEGTIWFDESAAEDRILAYLHDLAIPPHTDPTTEGQPNEDRADVRILDVGAGNGHLLFELRAAGWRAELVGVDYSSPGVQLARRIAAEREGEGEGESESVDGSGVEFYVWDLLRDSPGDWLGEGFTVVLDKGTFDAIGLSDVEVDDEGRKGVEVYGEKVSALVRDGGFLLVTSCNWTEEELRMWLVGETLEFYDAVEFPSFEFGGKRGQSVSCVCLRKVYRTGEGG